MLIAKTTKGKSGIFSYASITAAFTARDTGYKLIASSMQKTTLISFAKDQYHQQTASMSMQDTATIEQTKLRYRRGDAKPAEPDWEHRYSHNAQKVGPHSRPHSLAKLDGRTKEGAVLSRVRAELVEHVGGNPNNVQRMLIERCAWLSVRIAMLDKKIEQGKAFTQIDSNTYLAWNNSLVRTLARIGIDPHKRSNNTSALRTVMAEMIE